MERGRVVQRTTRRKNCKLNIGGSQGDFVKNSFVSFHYKVPDRKPNGENVLRCMKARPTLPQSMSMRNSISIRNG